ncbi:type II toxin-antitoxin system VapC family toxin [Sphingomonas corticis]|uniref:Type II toxin-antitoxin system VapC family toxin n=1 Tax=Sphingomonas corticis TaxID=2722791 RepID=A0ABX1CLE3_9SPHN|nr:type II toxin-antitoxin system VapC family toxin [Sphingomonas corticis]NJR78016.1 type II toxin-antitoxin system VapC family toxin [Sphingomonas corticis]
MRAVDTNVLARLILQDDPHQAAAARAVIEQPVWIPASVWLELGWVLSRRMGLERGTVAAALSGLLMTETVHVSDRNGLAWAIERYRAGADWADAVHLVASRGVADAFVTFDRGVTRELGDAPLPVETLA